MAVLKETRQGVLVPSGPLGPQDPRGPMVSSRETLLLATCPL